MKNKVERLEKEKDNLEKVLKEIIKYYKDLHANQDRLKDRMIILHKKCIAS